MPSTRANGRGCTKSCASSATRCAEGQAHALAARNLRQRFLARRLEFVAGRPGRQLRIVGDLQAQPEPQLAVLDRSGKIPVVAQLVRRLVIVLILEFLLLLPTPA